MNAALTLSGLRTKISEDGKEVLHKEGSSPDSEAAVRGRESGVDIATPAELKRSLRAAAAMLPLYSADWFLGVVAMDNSTFLTYPLLFLVSNGFLVSCPCLLLL